MFLVAAALLAATPANLSAVVASAKSGDTIKLAPGTYSTLIVNRRDWSPPLVIEADGATFPYVSVAKSSGFTWRGGSVVGTGTGPFAEGYGFKTFQSRNIEITGVKVSKVRVGMVIETTDGVALLNNEFNGMSSDGINIVRSRNVRIDGTKCRDFKSFPGAHPDCIQAWSRPTEPPVADVTITNTSAIGRLQGIGFFDHVRNGVPDGGFDRIVIRNNTILTTMPAALAAVNCRNCVIRDNLVNSLPNYEYRAQLNIYGGSVYACGNVVPMVPRQGTPPCPQ